jgi:hypothetical protein
MKWLALRTNRLAFAGLCQGGADKDEVIKVTRITRVIAAYGLTGSIIFPI